MGAAPGGARCLDVVDQMLDMVGDPVGARQFFEGALVPTVNDLKLLSYVVPVQSQYAVVRAYCGDYDGARQSITELRSFAVDELAAAELENQRQRVERIELHGIPTIGCRPS